MNRREIQNVEAHGGNAGKPRFRVAENMPSTC
jgi:hypothetical protein